MKYAHIYKLNNNGDQEIVATCYLGENGIVWCEGDDRLVENLKKGGIKSYVEPRTNEDVFFRDGLYFLEQLKFNFKTAYLYASDILEGGD